MREYPMLVYKKSDVHLLVSNDEEFDQAIESGWFPTVTEALAGKLDAAEVNTEGVGEDELPPDRDEIKVKMDELGIPFNAKLNDKQLLKQIDKKLKEKE